MKNTKDRTKISAVSDKHTSLFAPAIRIASIQNSRAVRWYILTLPSCHRGLAKGLQAEYNRCIRNGEPAFEFFAPTCEEVQQKNGAWVKTNRPLLYNYVFIRASENDIYRMMSGGLSLYSFLPRVKAGNVEYYPYISDEVMQNFQRVARSYAGVVPVCAPEAGRLVKGDRIRITSGKFKNAEATVVLRPGAGQREIVVCVDNWMWVPLLHVHHDEYEVIALNTDHMHVYTRLNNDRIFEALHEAMGRYHTARVTDRDRELARETLQQYGKLQMDSVVMRCKLYALLLPAYTLLGDRNAHDRLVEVMRGMLPTIKAEQSKALLLVTLYGCTGSRPYGDEAHALIDLWRAEESPKKFKIQLMRRLDDCDRRFGY